MAKKLRAYCCINVLAIIGAAFFLRLHYNPEPFNDLGMTKHQTTKVDHSVESGPRYAREINLIVGSGVLLIVGCMFWVFYRNIRKENHERIDKGIIKKEELEPISFRGWAIALFVFPGCIIIPVVIAVFFGFSHFW